MKGEKETFFHCQTLERADMLKKDLWTNTIFIWRPYTFNSNDSKMPMRPLKQSCIQLYALFKFYSALFSKHIIQIWLKILPFNFFAYLHTYTRASCLVWFDLCCHSLHCLTKVIRHDQYSMRRATKKEAEKQTHELARRIAHPSMHLSRAYVGSWSSMWHTWLTQCFDAKH